jgi:transcription initiation factor TFIID subunit 3
MSQAHDLHRALLRPAIIHILRAAGFHSTRPSVLETLTNIAERYLLLLASSTVQHACLSHNDPVPGITDIRMALSECGVLIPADSAAEEEWKEVMRIPVAELELGAARGEDRRLQIENLKRKRDEEDTEDVRRFKRWFDGSQHMEIRRIAGLVPDTTTTTGARALPAVGVGGGVIHAEDFLTVLRKKYSKGGDDSRLQGTVLGKPAEGREVLIEGGLVQRLEDWKPPPPRVLARSPEKTPDMEAGGSSNAKETGEADSSETEAGDTSGDTLMADTAPAEGTAGVEAGSGS